MEISNSQMLQKFVENITSKNIQIFGIWLEKFEMQLFSNFIY